MFHTYTVFFLYSGRFASSSSFNCSPIFHTPTDILGAPCCIGIFNWPNGLKIFSPVPCKPHHMDQLHGPLQTWPIRMCVIDICFCVYVFTLAKDISAYSTNYTQNLERTSYVKHIGEFIWSLV